MAENADGQEKSESPTDKKLSDARKKGQVPRSKELGTLLIMLLSAMWFLWLGPDMINDFVKTTTGGLSFDRDHAFDMKKASDLVFAQLKSALWMVMPFMIAMLMMAVLSNILVGGWLFSTEVMAPKLSKLNPIAGIKRMFSLKALVELLKALLKFVLMSVIAVLFIYSTLYELRLLGTVEVMVGMSNAGDLLVEAFLVMTLGLIVIAVIDAPYQLWHNAEEMKMTMQEVKDEYKQTEGSPEIKGRIRRMQREMAQRRMMQDVPNADVIITNPEHYAVALQYDATGGDTAPKVVAMGIDFLAAQIRSIAVENKIQIVRSPALARALYYNSEIGEVIPRTLFTSVAQILAMVYQLRAKKISKLDDFSNLPVPADLKQSP
jgi:flagellar biosynthetic protein FlhB